MEGMEQIEWRPVVGYESIYEVSSQGQIRRVIDSGPSKAGQFVASRPDPKTGYHMVPLRQSGVQRKVKLHQIVVKAFHGTGEPGLEPRHLDGDKSNNTAANLKWGTHSENMQDRTKHMEQGASKERLVAEVAAASGRSDAAASAAERSRITRDAAMVRARGGGVSYRQLQAATGLTRTGVYKALASSVGGSLRDGSTSSTPVD